MSLLKDKIELKVEETEFAVEQKLNTFPPLIKWGIIAGVIAIIPGYFIAKSASHHYWENNYKHNQLVAKASFENPEDLKISDTTITTTGGGVYSAVIEVTNLNLDLSLPETSYTMNFYNDQQQIITSYNDKFYLLPDQKKYLVAPKVTSSEKISSVGLEFPNGLSWEKRLTIAKIKLDAPTPTITQQQNPLAFSAEGAVVNNSSYNLKQVRIVFIVKDAEKKIVSVSQRDEFTLKPFERRSYKQLWPGVYAPDTTTVEVYADTNVLDSNNIQLQEAAPTPASDLSR